MKPIENSAATRGLAISLLVILNAIVLKEGYVSEKGHYLWLFITFPLLLAVVYDAIRQKPSRDSKKKEASKVSPLPDDNAITIGEKAEAI